ncbi:hypothetical protein [Streptomyces sp. NPDC048644]|uniref:hypothetical protein n=1 Tax=Streptomyces sp. NPDC048644 TaxID=3365582 RepID=UPI00371377E0
MITTRNPQHGRHRRDFSVSVDLAGTLAERYLLDAVERAKLTEPVALLVEFGDTAPRPGSARQLARELSGRGQLQAVVTRRGRGGQQLAKVMAADTLRAYAADCDQAGQLMRLERTFRKAA